MPFEKVGKDKYKSPSGRTFTKKQVALYYANGGKFPGEDNAKLMGQPFKSYKGGSKRQPFGRWK